VTHRKRETEGQLNDGRGGEGGWGGAKSCDAVKAWSSINHSIFSDSYSKHEVSATDIDIRFMKHLKNPDNVNSEKFSRKVFVTVNTKFPPTLFPGCATTVHQGLICSLFLKTITKFIVPDWGDKVNSMPDSIISPQSGTMNLAAD
jgi:hypothetical protein